MCNRRLRLAAWETGLKDFELARKAGIHPTAFSAIVNQHYKPNEKQKKAIAKAVKKPVSQLFEEAVAV